MGVQIRDSNSAFEQYTSIINSSEFSPSSIFDEIFTTLSRREAEFDHWSPQAQLALFSCLKSLIKDEISARSGIDIERLELLSKIAGLSPVSKPDQSNVTQEVNKCIANSLLLSQELRPAFCVLNPIFIIFERLSDSKELGLTTDTKFLYARILFLSTADPSTGVIRLVEEYEVVEVLSQLLSTLDFSPTAGNGGGFTPTMVGVDLLKLTFNLMVNYPKSYYSFCLGDPLDSSKVREKFRRSCKKDDFDPCDFICERFESLFSTLINIITNPQVSITNPLFHHGVQVLINFPPERFQLKLISINQIEKLGSLLVDAILGIAKKGKYSEELESEYDRLAPHVLLLVTLCRQHNSIKKDTATRLLPTAKDRKLPIGEGITPTSRLASILTMASFSGFKDALGELYFVLCDEDADLVVSKVGYGNIAGFLVNRQMSIGPKSSFDGSRTQQINPITGQYRASESNIPDTNQMTEEEQLREAERLFVLFERIKLNPAIQIRNPVEEAFHAVANAISRILIRRKPKKRPSTAVGPASLGLPLSRRSTFLSKIT